MQVWSNLKHHIIEPLYYFAFPNPENQKEITDNQKETEVINIARYCRETLGTIYWDIVIDLNLLGYKTKRGNQFSIESVMIIIF